MQAGEGEWMRTIIAGSREGASMADVEAAIGGCGWGVSVVISGCAPGVDELGEEWAKARGIAVERFPADWKRLKRAAGPIRNAQMAQAAEALVAVWDGSSPGTRDMVSKARAKGLKVHVHVFGSAGLGF